MAVRLLAIDKMLALLFSHPTYPPISPDRTHFHLSLIRRACFGSHLERSKLPSITLLEGMAVSWDDEN